MGGSADGFVARQLTRAMMREADLVLAVACGWTAFSVWASQPWLGDLAAATNPAFAVIAIRRRRTSWATKRKYASTISGVSSLRSMAASSEPSASRRMAALVTPSSSAGLVAALEWLGQPYRLTRVDMLGEMREPAYARINARHETPVLITPDGRALSETMAIAAWLETRDTERRISYAPGSPESARMHQLLAFINTGFTGAFSPLWVAYELNPPDPAYQVEDPAVARQQDIAADPAPIWQLSRRPANQSIV